MGYQKANLENNDVIAAKPFLSILITSYNRPNYLQKCIMSILDNEFNDFEIIISDDDSTESKKIQSVIDPYLKYDNIIFIKQAHNLGMANNWNFLVSNAKGKYVLILGDDDKCLPYTLSRLKYYIESYPDYDLYGFGYNVIDENDKFCYSRCSPKILKISLDNTELIGHLFVSGIIPFWVFHPFTICYKKEVSTKISYNVGASIGSDLLFLFDCVNSGKKLMVIPEVLFCWRKMQDKSEEGYQNLSNFRGSNIAARRNILYILEKRYNLKDLILRIVNSNLFRKKFLYYSVLTDKSVDKYNLDNLDLKKEHLRELIELYGTGNYFYARLRIKLLQINDYIKLFGLKGVIRLMVYGYYKLNFNIRMMKRKR